MTKAEKRIMKILKSGEKYGLEVGRELKDGVILQGRVYPILRWLEGKGLLTSRNGDPLPERGERPRRYYKLTKKGRETA